MARRRGRKCEFRSSDCLTGARYEITIDGVARTNRDTRQIAIEAANVLKAKNPHGRVVVRDRETGVTIEATLAPLPERLGRW